MDEKIYQTLKSAETEDWLDYHIVRPFSYYWVRFFDYFDIHPNTVTILSMIIGAASSMLYAHGSYYYEGWNGLVFNLFAILMLIIADILDCTDGQLARLTGKKSRLGRILDGGAGIVWFVPIYLAIVWRFYQHHDIEFSLLGINDTQENVVIATAVVFVMSLISGFLGMGGQQRLADYYIQVHLFFLKGEKDSELDSSRRQQEIYDQLKGDAPFYELMLQKMYVDYTRAQEKATPQFQRLMVLLRERYGSTDNIPEEVRNTFHHHSLALMKWNGLLTFNFRSAWFFLFCLLDIPVVNFLFEIVAMSMLTKYINHRHERFSQQIADSL
jgi:phosphatidylglycerophosphate synthase